MPKIKDITYLLQKVAPLSYQESYDNSGLQTGNPDEEVTGVLLTLDCTPAVIEEAINHKCNLIIAHHPVIFKPLKKLTGSNDVERVIITAIQHQIAIYSCHTNLDNVLPGVNARIADKLGLINKKILSPKSNDLIKLVTFAPLENTTAVLSALYAAGAGQIGDYKNCSFRTAGMGSFTPSIHAKPYIGEANKPEIVKECRMEVIFPENLKAQVVTALLSAHPYEEVAYDLYRLENTNQEVGAGMLGELPKAMPANEFISYLKEKMELNLVRHTNILAKPIRRIAVCGGAGSFLIKDAMKQQADVFITADLKYHDFFSAEDKIILADIGHYESEVFTKELFYDIIINNFTNFTVLKSKVNTNPVRYT